MNVTNEVTLLLERMKSFSRNNNDFFLITMGIVVYFLQCGFAFLEAGAVRTKNTTNILIKNILDSFVGGLAYWIVGYAFAFGSLSNAFIGYSNFAMVDLPASKFSFWFFQFVFAATAATIVSGALAERCEFVAYLAYSTVITGVAYPVVSHWAWDASGWLNKGLTVSNYHSQYQDFAGSSVVHVTGGIAALVGAILLGPRIGRFNEDGTSNEIKGHSVPLASLGGFILFFGFFAFNGGSQASISEPDDGPIVAKAVVNTIIAASVAAFTVLIIERLSGLRWSLLTTINGALAGMVAICAGCNVVAVWGAAVIGCVAALSYMFWSKLMVRIRIDDPLDAVAVHFGGGTWGTIGVALLNSERGVLLRWSAQSGYDVAWQLAGLLAIILWVGCVTLLLFGILRVTKLFRVPEEYELKGLDIPKHGEPAYPLAAYGHGWKDEDFRRMKDGEEGSESRPRVSSIASHTNIFKLMEDQKEQQKEQQQQQQTGNSLIRDGNFQNGNPKIDALAEAGPRPNSLQIPSRREAKLHSKPLEVPHINIIVGDDDDNTAL